MTVVINNFNLMAFVQCQSKILSQTIFVLINGKRRTLKGVSCNVWSSGIPKVILLTNDSTPQRAIVRPGAEQNFCHCVANLIKNGTIFYTQLLSGWNWPVFMWSVEV